MSDTRGTQDDLVLSDLADDVSTLKDFVHQQGQRDEVQQRAFDQLYEELRQYKNNFIFQAEKPLLLDLLLFYDSLNWFQESLLNQEMSGDVVADSFQYLVDEFLELLYRRDVLPMESSDRFSREKQKAIKVEYTSEVGQDWTVAKVVKRGFSRVNQVLRAEEVVVRRYKEETPSNENGSGS
jgi:molecular chaperone GrpE (heat shock protein)